MLAASLARLPAISFSSPSDNRLHRCLALACSHVQRDSMFSQLMGVSLVLGSRRHRSGEPLRRPCGGPHIGAYVRYRTLSWLQGLEWFDELRAAATRHQAFADGRLVDA